VMSFSARIASVALAGFAVGSFYFFGKRMTRFIFGGR